MIKLKLLEIQIKEILITVINKVAFIFLTFSNIFY